MRAALLILLCLAAAGIARAEAPDSSLRPASRPAGAEASRSAAAGTTTAPRPKRRQAQGAGLCGDPAIQGSVAGRIKGKIRGCGIDNAVQVHVVSGVTLSQPALMDCPTAQALKTWVERGVKPAVGVRGGGVAGLRVAAHYICRTRNNRKGAKISEHGKGRAIDISAITLFDGTEVSVLTHWGTGRRGRMLTTMHQRACGPFGTVLGPNADSHHRDHFHLDTARYRKGSYCR